MQVFEIKSDEPIQNGRKCPKSDESSDSELQYPKSNRVIVYTNEFEIKFSFSV